MVTTTRQRPPARESSPRRPRRRRVVAGVVLLVVLVLSVSVGRALLAPGTDSTAARLAEWGRDHHLSWVIDRLETATYQAPKEGGTPAADSPLARPRPSAAAPDRQRPVTELPAILPVAPAPLPGEGAWTTVDTVAGKPALRTAFLRPDAVHTGLTAGVVWMDPTLVSMTLHPGTLEPGGAFATPPQVTTQERPNMLGAFNGGFRLESARGGFLLDGRTVGTLRDGAASLVITRDGVPHVQQWGRDASRTPDVVAVRQNLDLLVDGGRVVPGLDANRGGAWGKTLGNKLFVWRSGVGETASGALVYVASDGLSAQSLATLLQRAGAVRAMELDINPQWTSFVLYPQVSNLLPDMQHDATRYRAGSSRDFITVTRRGP